MALAMKNPEWTLTLMTDEVHFEYKGGFATGTATNSNIAARTAYVFLIQSLLSSNKDVHIYLLPNSMQRTCIAFSDSPIKS